MEQENLEMVKLLYHAASDEELRTNGHWHLMTALRINNPHVRKEVFDTLFNDPRIALAQRRSESSERPKNQTILTDIAYGGDIVCLESLLQILHTDRRNDIITLLQDEGDTNCCSPLWYAADKGHTNIVNALCLLDTSLIRPQLLYSGRFGDHIVAVAARSGDSLMMTALLRACPEYADRPCSGLNTPLSYARHNSSDAKAAGIAEALITTGAVDIEFPNENGTTPLMGAFMNGKIELCKILIRHGADISRIIGVSPSNELICLVSTGIRAQDLKIKDILLEVSHDETKTVEGEGGKSKKKAA